MSDMRGAVRRLTIGAALLALAACGDQAATTSDAAGDETAEAAPSPAQGIAVGEPAPRAHAAVDDARLLNARNEPDQWLTYNGDRNEQRFSPLDQITDQNLGDLGLAWYVDLPTNQNIESTPLFIDGVLYLSLPWSEVEAIDARTGQVLWHYDPEVPGEWNVNVCCGLDNRGVAAWDGKIIFGTLDGRLIALDAATGEEVWDVKATPEGRYSITSAPRVADGKVFIGESGGEFDIRGYIAAYDVENGDLLWRFWTVPGNPALGFEDETQEIIAATWKTPGWWERGGGGPVWDGITYDPQTDLVLFGVGNGAPWSAVDRDSGGGDNLFLSSIVAVHADDGSYAWHYQTTPWETWDYDAVQQLMILDVEIDGAMRHVAMQASKNGFFYVLDAATGELLAAKPFAGVNWATGVDMQTGRPIEVPDARYDVTDEAFNMLPGPAGAHAWQGMSYSPETGLVYIPTTDMWSIFAPSGEVSGQGPSARARYIAEHPDYPTSFIGRLVAWDPIAQKEIWRSEDYVNPRGGIQAAGGALATGGNVVFIGNFANKAFSAYRATDGEKLWTFDAKTGVFPGPISYELDGEQYIALAVGGPPDGGYYAPNGARLLVFKLGGTAALPDLPPYAQPPVVNVAQFASAEVVDRGAAVFEATCMLCHGDRQARATFPDLTRSQALTDQALFDSIVRDGVLAANGMASFADRLSAEDTTALRAYLISKAQTALATAAPAAPAPAPASAETHGDPE
jgi:PQQ-dependent dehydrogenase (methanol/ethanol family)